MIPARIYSPPPTQADLVALSPTQRDLLACIYTRHHDGYVREASVRQIIDSQETFAPPFVVQLLSEYVLEIVSFISDHRAALDTGIVRTFAKANPTFLARTRQRAISYWNYYFRGLWHNKAEYPALQVLDFLETLAGYAA